MTTTLKKLGGATSQSLAGGRAVTPSQHRRRWASETDVPYGLCQCGCGERTTLAPFTWAKRGNVQGCPQRFMRGHDRHTGKCIRGPRGNYVTRAPSMHSVLLAVAYDPGPRTLEETAEIMGVTRERVRQIEDGALRKLRRECGRVGLSWADFREVAGFTEPEGYSD